MIRWSPSTELANLHGAMDRLFEDFFGSAPAEQNGGRARGLSTYVLPIDVLDLDSGYEIHAQVPGFRPEEVDVTFSEGLLRIVAQHSSQSENEVGGYLRREVAYGNFQRTIQLPGDVKDEDISARFENGILTVSVPKRPRPQPKKIAVSSNGQTQRLAEESS